MRRVFCGILALILILSCSALSEENPFIFRNGVQFGMSASEVITCEGSEPSDRASFKEDSPWEYLQWDNETVSQFVADLQYVFYDGQLKIIFYELRDKFGMDARNVGYLNKAISELYGKGEIPEPEEILAVMDTVAPGLYGLDSFDYRYVWRLDGLRIFFLDYGESDYVILYVSDTLEQTEMPKINTNGL